MYIFPLPSFLPFRLFFIQKKILNRPYLLCSMICHFFSDVLLSLISLSIISLETLNSGTAYNLSWHFLS